ILMASSTGSFVAVILAGFSSPPICSFRPFLLMASRCAPRAIRDIGARAINANFISPPKPYALQACGLYEAIRKWAIVTNGVADAMLRLQISEFPHQSLSCAVD